MNRLGAIALTLAVNGCGILLASSDDDSPPALPPVGPDGAADGTAPVDGGSIGEGGPPAEAGIDASSHRDLVVFVTDATTNGAFGGLAGGDSLCKIEAVAAGLGDVVAWLSTSAVNATSRLPDGDVSWHLAGGPVVFASKTELLTAKPPQVGIDRDAIGVQMVTDFVWTGTTYTGNVSSKGQCVNGGNAWASQAPNTAGAPGRVGSTTMEWTEATAVTLSCDKLAHLICFER